MVAVAGYMGSESEKYEQGLVEGRNYEFDTELLQIH